MVSEKDVNNQFPHNTNLKSLDCPLLSTDNQVETENNPQNVIARKQTVIYLQYFKTQFITESGPSINSEQSSPGNVFPISVSQMVEKSFLSLPRGNANIGKNIPSASTPKPPSQYPIQNYGL